MFQKLSQSFTNILKKWTQSSLSEKEITSILNDIRSALIDADTAVIAADAFIEHLRKTIHNVPLDKNIKASQQIQAWIHHTLIETLGAAPIPPVQKKHGPQFIMLAGLQGAGKTTTTVKLARWITNEHALKVGVTSVDFHRPAAREQLKILADQATITYIHTEQTSPSILRGTLLQHMKDHALDVVLVDTAGRLSIDDAMMQELSTLKNTLAPQDIFYVIDSQTGQDAASTARQFHNILSFNAAILTKCDADSKGGVALSLKTLTHAPIAFMGEGEKLDNLSIFDPERIANRMLDLGDIATLVSTMKKNIDEKEALKQSKKIAQGDFDLNDFLQQIQQIQAMGGMSSILGMLPGAHSMPAQLKDMMNDKKTAATCALIQSMTPKERRHPALLQQISRKNRIIKGSGRSKNELSELLKQFDKMKVMIKKISPAKMRMAMDLMAKKT